VGCDRLRKGAHGKERVDVEVRQTFLRGRWIAPAQVHTGLVDLAAHVVSPFVYAERFGHAGGAAGRYNDALGRYKDAYANRRAPEAVRKGRAAESPHVAPDSGTPAEPGNDQRARSRGPSLPWRS
jgi:hypothetical protein